MENLTKISTAIAVLLIATTVHAHNITRILADHPDFSTMNHYLTVTHLADEINRRRTITVCVVDNAAMGDLLAQHYPINTIKNILSLHVFADYFGSKKLHQITKGSTTTSTLFQASGEAAGTSGYVNITDLKGGKVGFSPADDNADGGGSGGHPMATYVRSIVDLPYIISVIQISRVLTTSDAEAPVSAPSILNVTSLMVKQGCKAFSDLIIAQGVDDTFSQSVTGGLTIFCPSDESLKLFALRYKNLTSNGKSSLLLYHGVPVYNSLGMLKSSNGVLNTLATDGKNKYDFTVQNDGDNVKLETNVVTATITATLIDSDPLAVFKVDKVLLPRALFKADPAAGPKPARSSAAADDADSPGPSADDEAAADEVNSSDGGCRVAGCAGGVLVGMVVGILAFFLLI